QKPRWLVLNKMDLLPAEDREAMVDYLRESLGWEDRIFAISAARREGTRELCDELMEAIAEHRLRLEEDEDFRAAEQELQQQLEYEIRQSIARARALWRERKGGGGGFDDDDDLDVEIEYVN